MSEKEPLPQEPEPGMGSEKMGDWKQNEEGVFELKEEIDNELEIEEITKEELKNPEKIKGLKEELDELYKEKLKPEDLFLLKFESMSDEQKNELRRLTGLSDSKLKEYTQAVREKDTKKIRIIQDSMRPMRDLDFEYQDELLGGEIRDEDGNIVDKDWKVNKKRKKIEEK